ncbi:MAG: stage II sporulation protein R [Clostridiales bacterium]|jgi:stage II sporulation protein R|nr:stage II sporulation protein R [Clostridiales bacterium]
MKKKDGSGYIALILAAVILSAVFFGNALIAEKPKADAAEQEYLRIHIRANSNSSEDQSVKYRVRDEIIKLLTPELAECTSLEAALARTEKISDDIIRAANAVLRANGFGYTARAAVRTEEFPTRIYDGLTLEKGIYTALIIELGSAAGDNWWCIACPPLCFIPAADDGSGTVKYRSKILEIIRAFFES